MFTKQPRRHCENCPPAATSPPFAGDRPKLHYCFVACLAPNSRRGLFHYPNTAYFFHRSGEESGIHPSPPNPADGTSFTSHDFTIMSNNHAVPPLPKPVTGKPRNGAPQSSGHRRIDGGIASPKRLFFTTTPTISSFSSAPSLPCRISRGPCLAISRYLRDRSAAR